MPRNYKRKPGNRPYKNYTEETLQEALQKIRLKVLTIRGAAERYGIHRNTLFLKLHGKHNHSVGGQTVLSQDEEHSLIAHVIAVSTYGFPVTGIDLRFIVKAYLDKRGRRVQCFKDNMPGTEWLNSFLQRHKDILANRVARNISISRASVNHEVLNNFFDSLESELENVPPCNLWNYDETNLGDDPGATKVLIRRGTKYPEQIRNSTKACTSMMICGNAAGEIAPVYVVYKSEKMWQNWTENGPDHARYNRTKSGWFDYQCFEDWFSNVMLPILKKQEGKKILIGDNLSSHLNIDVVRQCEANNIAFIALPPNATHLLQPLDVSYFRPMKGKWREILREWKDTVFGSRCATIPKDTFPSLLKKLLHAMKIRGADILAAGFRKCGIYPLNREPVLARLPEEIMNAQEVMKDALSDSFLEQLERKRAATTTLRQRQRRKKVNVAPGKSISAADLLPETDATNSFTDDPINQSEQKVQRKRKMFPDNFQTDSGPSTSKGSKKIIKSHQRDDTTSDDSDILSLRESSTSPMSKSSDLSENEDNAITAEAQEIELIGVGQYVIVRYERALFPGVVTKTDKNGALVNAMEKCGASWKWPNRMDQIYYENHDIIKKIAMPIQISRRGIFHVPEMKKICGILE